MFLTASSFSLLRWYACSACRPAARAGIGATARRWRAMRRSLLAPLLYLVGGAAAFVMPELSLAIQVIVPLIYIVPQRMEGT